MWRCKSIRPPTATTRRGKRERASSLRRAASSTALVGSLNSDNTASLTATVTPQTSGNYPYGPTQTVSFYDGNNLLATVPLSGSTASYKTAALTGSHSFTAVYNGDQNFTASPASNAVPLNIPVNPQISFPVALTYTYGQTFQAVATSTNGDPGTFTYSAQSSNVTVTPGGLVTVIGIETATIVASEAAAPGYNQGSHLGTFNALQAPTSIALVGSVLSSPPNTVSLTATVTPTNAGTYSKGVTNSVKFYDGGVLLATVPLNGNTATYSSSALTGSQSFTAMYTGDNNYLASAMSNAVQLNVTVAPTITFTAAAAYAYGQSFQLTAKSANDPGTFTYSGTGPATVTATGIVTVTGEGAVTLKATEAAAPGYNAGTASTGFTRGAGQLNHYVNCKPDEIRQYFNGHLDGKGSPAICRRTNHVGQFLRRSCIAGPRESRQRRGHLQHVRSDRRHA